jgi:hypothetical protein
MAKQSGISAGQMRSAIAAATNALRGEISKSRAEAVGFTKGQVEDVTAKLKTSASAQSQFAEEKARESANLLTEKMTNKTAPITPTKRRSIFTSKTARELTQGNLKYFYSLYK